MVGGTNEAEEFKVRNNNNNLLHIPDDLVFSILSKLPLKSFKRFGCVRKSWSLLSENPHFMNMLRNHFLSNHHRRSHDHDTTFLFLQEPEFPAVTYQRRFNASFYLLSNESFHNRLKLDLPPSFHGDDGIIYILSSVCINGIFCLAQHRTSGRVEIFRAVLWNPATAEYMLIPPSPDESVPPYRDPFFHFHGFGYDRVKDDYKLIRYISFFHLSDEDEDVPEEDRSYDPLLEIYSLRSNSWKILEIDMPHDVSHCYYDLPQHGTQVYMDGVCHWWGRTSFDNVEDCLVSFNLSNELLSTTPMLLDVDESCDFRTVERHLVVLNESIAFISNCFEANTFHISILGELGVRESWIKLFIVGPIPSIECPIGVGKKGDICFKQTNDELVWIDLSTQIIDQIGVKGERHCCQMGIYTESLLPIGGINN